MTETGKNKTKQNKNTHTHKMHSTPKDVLDEGLQLRGASKGGKWRLLTWRGLTHSGGGGQGGGTMSLDGDRNLQVNKGNFSALDLRERGFRECCDSTLIIKSDLIWREAVCK